MAMDLLDTSWMSQEFSDEMRARMEKIFALPDVSDEDVERWMAQPIVFIPQSWS